MGALWVPIMLNKSQKYNIIINNYRFMRRSRHITLAVIVSAKNEIFRKMLHPLCLLGSSLGGVFDLFYLKQNRTEFKMNLIFFFKFTIFSGKSCYLPTCFFLFTKKTLDTFPRALVIVILIKILFIYIVHIL